MTKEHYDPAILKQSRKLYEQIRPWVWGRRDVTLIGGWAVFELVDPDRAQQSRDVDLVMQSREALFDFARQMETWGLIWRRRGRTTFNDCVLRNDPKRQIVVDVLLGRELPNVMFGGPRMRCVPTVKRVESEGPLPSLEWLIADKLATVPRRTRDAEDKRLKDFVDVHNMVFYNREGVPPRKLRQGMQQLERVAPFLAEAQRHDEDVYSSIYGAELVRLVDWLTGSE